MCPKIIHTRKEYVSYFNLSSELIQHKSSLNKIIAVGSDSEKIVGESFKDLMPNMIHLLCDLHMKGNIKEKALKLKRHTKSRVGTLIKYIFGKPIEGKVEKGLADSLTTEEFTATMTVLKQKWRNIGEKGKQFYHYFKDNKLYQIKSCMSAEERVIVGLQFPPKPNLQNANECMNSVLKRAGPRKCKRISEADEKLTTGVKK